MKKQGMLSHIVKTAVSDMPLWVHVPGLPFTLPGTRVHEERLPGMLRWAPRPLIERVAKGMTEGKTIDELAKREAQEGLLSRVGIGAGLGGVGGTLAGRLTGGQAAAQPFKDIMAKGLGKDTMKGLSKLPLGMRMLPIFGLLGGGGLGAAKWFHNREGRRELAEEVAQGLLTEHQLRQRSLGQASNRPPTALQKLPVETARVQAPIAVTAGNTGV